MEIKFDPKKILIVKIDDVRPNKYNPKDKDTDDFKHIKTGIEKKGQRLPIVVRENKGFEIIDGEQRWRACKDLNFESVVVYNEGKVSDKEAKELTIWYQQQVPFNEIELAGLVADIVTNYDDYELPYDQEQIDDYVKMTDFDWDQYNQAGDAIEGDKINLSIVLSEKEYDVVIKAFEKAKEAHELPNREQALVKICEDYLQKES